METKDVLLTQRVRAGLSRRKVADALGVSVSAVNMWEQGERTPKPESLVKLAELYGVNVSVLLGAEEPDTHVGSIAIPVLGEVAAGYPMFATENILDYEDISAALATQGEYFALRIKGDSMLPRMREGDVVIVRRQPSADDGQTVVVLVNGESATVKKLQTRPDGIMLIPSNPDFSPLFYSSKAVQSLPVTILGVVVELRAKYV